MAKIRKENAMLLDIQYIKPNRRENQLDYLYVIWKDLDTGEKHLKVTAEPPMEIYFEKPEYRDHSYNKNYQKHENLDSKVVKYKDIIYAIANDMGDAGKQKLNDCFNTRNYQGLKEFMMYPYVYGADYDVRAWYRHQWKKNFDNSRVKHLTKGCLDIEVDVLESIGMPNPVFNPIDLVTVIDHDTKESYTFSLVGVECKERDMTHMTDKQKEKELERRELYASRLKQQEEVLEDPSVLEKMAHEMFDESYPGMNYNFYFYKDERKLLTHLFQLINKLKLDFIQIWNIGFDIPYIVERLKALGLNPADVICHPDFPIKECWFKKDTINFQVKNKADYFHCSSYTIFTDQMRNYAAIRKGQSELRSNKLTYIGQKEVQDEKLDYSEVGNIKTLSYKNFIMYILYNIKDVLLQYGIENVTSDLDTYYLTSYSNITPYESEFKQTVKLRNVQYASFDKQGLVPGENVNSILYNYNKNKAKNEDGEEEEEEGFEGALVGNPGLIEPFGAKIFGKRMNSVFLYSIDFDMSAFYPSTINAMNIDPSTLIFKCIMDSSQFDVRGGDLKYNGITDVQLVDKNNDSFAGDVAGEFFDNLQTKNILSTAYKWFALPSVDETFKELSKLLG